MPSSDYAVAGGGALKLKGAGIDKKKKKKRPKPADENPASSSTEVTKTDTSKESSAIPRRSISPEEAEREMRKEGGRQKTDAEKRYEETRRKRMEDKLKTEGVKTHKEKVEELNKYLSGLSEHHDMPKIGPG